MLGVARNPHSVHVCTKAWLPQNHSQPSSFETKSLCLLSTRRKAIEIGVDLLMGFLIWAMYYNDVEFNVILHTIFKSLVTE